MLYKHSRFFSAHSHSVTWAKLAAIGNWVGMCEDHICSQDVWNCQEFEPQKRRFFEQYTSRAHCNRRARLSFSQAGSKQNEWFYTVALFQTFQQRKTTIKCGTVWDRAQEPGLVSQTGPPYCDCPKNGAKPETVFSVAPVLLRVNFRAATLMRARAGLSFNK